MIVHARELIGRPVLVVSDGTIVAEVKDVLIDPATASVVGFALRGRGFFSSSSAGRIDIADVQGIGPDAITIAQHSQIQTAKQPSDEPAQQQARAAVPGLAVMTDLGEVIGKVRDAILDFGGTDRQLVGYEIDRKDGGRGLIDRHDVLSVSDDAVVVGSDVGVLDARDVERLALTQRP